MFYKNRPKIKVKKTELDFLIEWLTIVLLVVYIIFVYLQYQNLPASIPTHFDNNGVPNEFGAKDTIWILPLIAFILIVGMRILSNYPYLFNYWVKITEENAQREYRFANRVFRFTSLFVLLLFMYISYATVQISIHKETGTLSPYFSPIVLGCSIIFAIYILIKKIKIK